MTTTAIFSVKGGQGSSTVAAAIALLKAREGRVFLVDPTGDADVVLGAREVHHNLEVVTSPGHVTDPDADVVVDCGTHDHDWAEGADRVLLVTRSCFLALRHAQTVKHPRPDGIVLLLEEGRSLAASDVESAVGVPVVAQVAVTAQVARGVDAGLLALRMPRSLERELRAVLR